MIFNRRVKRVANCTVISYLAEPYFSPLVTGQRRDGYWIVHVGGVRVDRLWSLESVVYEDARIVINPAGWFAWRKAEKLPCKLYCCGGMTENHKRENLMQKLVADNRCIKILNCVRSPLHSYPIRYNCKNQAAVSMYNNGKLHNITALMSKEVFFLICELWAQMLLISVRKYERIFLVFREQSGLPSWESPRLYICEVKLYIGASHPVLHTC